MVRLAITFFLHLSVLLFGGFNYLFALTTQTTILSASQSGKTNLMAWPSDTTPMFMAAASYPTESIHATEIEEEEEESTSCRKYASPSGPNYFIASFYVQLPNPFARHLQDRLPWCEHLSFYSSHKYIVQRVIKV